VTTRDDHATVRIHVFGSIDLLLLYAVVMASISVGLSLVIDVLQWYEETGRRLYEHGIRW
jgi:hypothetical protein